MLPLRAALVALGLVLASGCSSPEGDLQPAATVESPIAFGALDATHTAVVALLSPVGTTQLQQCTGSVVRVSGGQGTVLTAAHCCNTFIPTVVVAASSYVGGKQSLGGGTPQPPSYAVVPGSVYYDALYAQDSGLDHDFCMLAFSGARQACPRSRFRRAPTASSWGRSSSTSATASPRAAATAQRMSGTDAVDQQLTPLLFLRFSQGGPDSTPGTCDGDSGGPSLLPATAAQAQQKSWRPVVRKRRVLRSDDLRCGEPRVLRDG